MREWMIICECISSLVMVGKSTIRSLIFLVLTEMVQNQGYDYGSSAYCYAHEEGFDLPHKWISWFISSAKEIEHGFTVFDDQKCADSCWQMKSNPEEFAIMAVTMQSQCVGEMCRFILLCRCGQKRPELKQINKARCPYMCEQPGEYSLYNWCVELPRPNWFTPVMAVFKVMPSAAGRNLTHISSSSSSSINNLNHTLDDPRLKAMTAPLPQPKATTTSDHADATQIPELTQQCCTDRLPVELISGILGLLVLLTAVVTIVLMVILCCRKKMKPRSNSESLNTSTIELDIDSIAIEQTTTGGTEHTTQAETKA